MTEFSLFQRLRGALMRAAQRCGIDTAGKGTDQVLEAMEARILELIAENADAQVQLHALTRMVEKATEGNRDRASDPDAPSMPQPIPRSQSAPEATRESRGPAKR